MERLGKDCRSAMERSDGENEAWDRSSDRSALTIWGSDFPGPNYLIYSTSMNHTFLGYYELRNLRRF
jgi:hypothetical protein